MQLAPKPWTHDHTHRLFHISLGLCFAFIAGTFSAGLVVAWMQTSASTTPVSHNVAIRAQVGDVEPGPTETGPNGSTPVPSPTLLQVPVPANPWVTVSAVAAHNQVVQTPQGQVAMPAFDTRRPVFAGATNISNALIFIQVSSQNVIYSTAIADSQGQWRWQAPEDLAVGIHKIYVTARDQDNSAVFASAALDFYVNPASPSETPKPITPVTGLLKGLFGIFVSIPDQYKIVPPGSSVVADLRFFSGGSGDGGPQDIQYIMVGPDNDIVFEVTETIPPGKELAFRKTFITHPNARPGVYRIIVKTPRLENVAVASDTFEIRPLPGQEGSLQRNIYVTPVALGLMASLLLLFVFLTALTYHRVWKLTHTIKKHMENSQEKGNK